MNSVFLAVSILLLLLHVGCESPKANSKARPTDEVEELSGYLDSVERDVDAKSEVEITVGRSRLKTPVGISDQAFRVRLSQRSSVPSAEADEVASIGKAVGDIIEIELYNAETGMILSSSDLKTEYEFTQTLDSEVSRSELGLIVVVDPNTEAQQRFLIPNDGLGISPALRLTTENEFIIRLKLKLTNATLWLVKVDEQLLKSERLAYANELASGESEEAQSKVIVKKSSSSRTSSGASGNSGSDEQSEETALQCPDGYVFVKANSSMAVNFDFCVMKYEAKNTDNRATSVPQGLPWTVDNVDDAISRCRAVGSGYDLISNAQWQTIARDLESATDSESRSINWQDGSNTGASPMNRGHSDSNPNFPCDGLIENVQTDCSSADPSSPFSQKRTHTLSDGELIWDLGGNVVEWTNDKFDGFAYGQDRYWGQYYLTVDDVSCLASSGCNGPQGNATNLFGPAYSANLKGPPEYGGFGYMWLNYLTGRVTRGGRWDSGVWAGLFGGSIGPIEPQNRAELGFRCVYSESN